MDPLLILSPHMDDAVLSCGQLMAGRPDVKVVTAFAGVPPRSRMLTTYDANCGFMTAGHAIRRRREEDRAAMRVLKAGAPLHLGYLDGQYEPERNATFLAVAIAQTVMAQARQSKASIVMGPMGLAHPDHYVTAQALAEIARAGSGLECWLYEDLPSRVLYPEETANRLAQWREHFPAMQLGFLGTGDRAVKEEAIACYRSQLWALDPPTYLVPERHWRLEGPCAE